MNSTRWVFVVLFACAVFYEVVASVQHSGNTISQMVWDLFEAQPMWRYAMIVLFLHFILGAKVYEKFLGWWK